MPTGKQLEDLTASINDNLQVINQIQRNAGASCDTANITGTSYFNVSGTAKSYFNSLDTPGAAVTKSHHTLSSEPEVTDSRLEAEGDSLIKTYYSLSPNTHRGKSTAFQNEQPSPAKA